jgi:NAD(P)H-hydrate epimerase
MVSLTRKQVREVDRLAIEQLGIPGIVLMENAGINTTSVILDLLADELDIQPSDAHVVILCGSGNNAGDGYVIARHLHNWGADVTIFAVTDPDQLNGDAAINHLICSRMGLPILPVLTPDELHAHGPAWNSAHILVDALLGTGFSGQVRPHLADVIQYCSQLTGPTIVAVDVPSGLDCDTGKPSNATLRADVTVTFVAPKVGYDSLQAQPYLGDVLVVDIGTPPELIERVLAASPAP